MAHYWRHPTHQTTDDVTTDETTDETTAAGGLTFIRLPTGGGKRKISFNKRLKRIINGDLITRERRHMIISPYLVSHTLWSEETSKKQLRTFEFGVDDHSYSESISCPILSEAGDQFFHTQDLEETIKKQASAYSLCCLAIYCPIFSRSARRGKEISMI